MIWEQRAENRTQANPEKIHLRTCKDNNHIENIGNKQATIVEGTLNRSIDRFY